MSAEHVGRGRPQPEIVESILLVVGEPDIAAYGNLPAALPSGKSSAQMVSSRKSLQKTVV